jgi:hypothetical protein
MLKSLNTVACAALLSLPVCSGAATSAATAQPPLDPITVEAQRQREAIRRQVSLFITSITVNGFDEAVARWQSPICPLVAGLPRDMGELVLQRVSLAAKNAGAPLAPEKCDANFFVVVSTEPDVLLKKWHARDRQMFRDDRGLGPIKRFLASPRPVRIWYNAGNRCPGELASDLGLFSAGQGQRNYPTCTHSGASGTRLGQNVRAIESVIVVIDAKRVVDLNIGQLSDYVAMVGMAEVRLDRDPGPVTTILRVLDDGTERPQGLSVWDEAFLKSLYHADPANIMQLSLMKTQMLDYVAPQSR